MIAWHYCNFLAISTPSVFPTYGLPTSAHPSSRIADKAAKLFAEQTIEEIPIGPGLKRFRFELGDQTKAKFYRNYDITAANYRKGKVGDANAQIYFLNGFNTIDIPSEFSAMLR